MPSGTWATKVEIVGPMPARKLAAQDGRRSLLGRVKAHAPRWLFEILQLGYNGVSSVKLWRAAGRVRPDFIYERYALFNVSGLLVARARGVP